MQIETQRFGTIELKDEKIIHFPVGLPGFEDIHEFILLEVEESRPLFWLQSTSNMYIALPVIIPFEILDDYYFQVRDQELEELHIEDQNDLLILCVVVIPEDIQNMTANLAAPIIVNTKPGIGKQIIIDAKETPVRFPIYELIMQKLKGGGQNAGVVEEEK
jgi:flagellar assembly factor FliW